MAELLKSEHWRAFQRREFGKLKEILVEGAAAAPSFGRNDDLDRHFDMLMSEFTGRSHLELFHAIVIVLIRRGIEKARHAELFNAMWQAEQGFLCRTLDIRWLISACDTIVDVSERSEDAAVAYAGTLFMNTIKLYETENVASGTPGARPGEQRSYDPINGLVPLFGGLSAFVIGHGDMIANLHARARSICRGETPAQAILAELIGRANEHDTVLRRFRDVHQKQDTLWHGNLNTRD